MGISLSTKGTFSHIEHYLKMAKEDKYIRVLDKYGARGVELLSSATPIRTGNTAHSWEYEIVRDSENNTVSLVFHNTHVEGDPSKYTVNIALLLQYGHATRNGGWIQGIDYINPTIQPLFQELAEQVWKEIRKI